MLSQIGSFFTSKSEVEQPDCFIRVDFNFFHFVVMFATFIEFTAISTSPTCKVDISISNQKALDALQAKSEEVKSLQAERKLPIKANHFPDYKFWRFLGDKGLLQVLGIIWSLFMLTEYCNASIHVR